ncbi:MAG: M4 family metallopeptidase, partial [Bdellovibrionales bacterium]|nr:M4 family metallopeptidase [Bdellovibrionales bacterium]
SDALDIVAHEYAHSVINATADFAGSGEAGALNEGLADVFGKAVEGLTSENTVMGASAGHPLRDLMLPSAFGDPETYSEFVITSADRGGVHHNSTIVSRALALTILGWPGRAGAGAVPVTRLILDSMRHGAHSPGSTLEAFAAQLSDACRARALGFCDTLEAAFTETELLASY